MDIDLCAKVEFQLRYVVKNGVGCTGWVSRHRTQVNADGQCEYLEGQLVLNRERGLMGLAVISEGKLCYGGFANVNGNVRPLVRCILHGHLVIMFSTTVCDPQKVRHMLQPGCDRPPVVDSRCYERPIPPGRQCVYCVDTGESPNVECTIEQDVNTYPCGAQGVPIGGALMPHGFMIDPTPGTFDITGDDAPFRANNGLTGLVRYYLQNSVPMAVEPLFTHPDNANFCDVCGAWLCNIILSYANTYAAWVMQCTTVWPAAEETLLGACCYFLDREHTIFDRCNDTEEFQCESLFTEWRGPGSRCEHVDCLSRHCEGIDVRAPCCLPDGRCIEVTEASCEAHGGLWMGGDVCRFPDGSFVSMDRPGCEAAGGLWVGGQICGQCATVTCPGQDINETARQFVLTFGEPIGFVQFGAGWQSQPPNCFPLMDNHCFTGGPDSGLCGPAPATCWTHLFESDPQLLVLDSITLSCDMRLAETSQEAVNRYPHAEPKCVEISNAALAEVGRQVNGLTNHSRLNSYNRRSLNQWWERKWFDCATEAPVIADVEVQPYQTPCAFPAELVLTGIWADLWLSGDMGHNTVYPPTPGYGGQVRVSAVFKVTAFLAIRLLEGWEAIECPIHVTNAAASPCNPVLSDPERYMILASDGCSRVPLQVEWRGLQGPRPYSRGPFAYENRSQGSGMCGDLLCAIDGLVVPGEVNNLADPDGRQRFEGDVVLLIDEDIANCLPREG